MIVFIDVRIDTPVMVIGSSIFTIRGPDLLILSKYENTLKPQIINNIDAGMKMMSFLIFKKVAALNITR